MATKTATPVLDAPTVANADPVEAARVVAEQAKERVVEVEAEKQSIAAQQQQLGIKDAERFYELQKQYGEMDAKIHLARVTALQAKIAFCDAYAAKARTELPILDGQIADLLKEMEPIAAKRAALGMKANKIREVVKHYRGQKTSYEIALGNLQNEWADRLAIEHAPVVRNLLRRPGR